MAETATMKKVYNEIKALRRELTSIKKHIIDTDSIMTSEERRTHEQSMKELREGKTIPLSQLKKELGI